jgi:hypothetical protein
MEATQPAHEDSSRTGAAEYPLRNPTAWQVHEKLSVNFSRVASGWLEVDADSAASRISKAMGSPVNVVEQDSGCLFIAGNMGFIGKTTSEASKNLPETVKKIGDSLRLTGDLSIESKKASLAGSYARIRQTVGNLPIYGARLALHIDSEGMANAIVGKPAPEGLKVVDSQKKLELRDAIEVVAHDLDKPSMLLTCEAEEILLPVGEELRPCYLVRALSREPLGDWRGFVSPDGELLALFNIASATSGQANGYQINPSRSPLIESLELTELLDPPNALTGPRSEVWGQNQTRVHSDDGKFVFDPKETEFDEPQLYYFLQCCWSAVNRLIERPTGEPFLDDEKFKPIKANVHAQDARNNAFYMPDNGQLYFGDTADGRCSSRSLDIVLHEFGHVISDSVCELGRSMPNVSSRAISEGFSDYFAATMLNHPVIADDFAPQNQRTCANHAKFPPSFAGEEHEIGTIWAAFLWDLRQNPQIGQAEADAIVVQSLTYLGPWRTIIQGVDALLQADRHLFPEGNSKKGKHEDLIRDAFKNRRRP